ncbi:phage tail protein [Primorskyibacter sp. 2E107]|uniref:phage tail protein n=1 Tax=Primorskyibacter sp. 2E107 TaxID=3403458 RepID=UPI003AF78D94
MGNEYIGQALLVGYDFAQRNFAKCDGQLIAISQNTALFSLLGTIYGGDGRTTFGLPDLRGRTPIHYGRGPGLSDYRIGQHGGTEQVTLTAAEMPSHTHNPRLRAENRNGNVDTPEGQMIAGHAGGFRSQSPADDVVLDPAAITEQAAGGSQPHTNLQPYLAMNYQICLYGIFPSRN